MKIMKIYALPIGTLFLLSAVSLLSSVSVGCANASGDPETDGPKGTEPGYVGVVSGPDGEVTHLGYENAPNSQENKPPDGADAACNSAESCMDACHCAGQNNKTCQDICGESGDDGDGDGGIDDYCAGLTDPCEMCVCDNLDDATTCLDICSQ